MHIKNKILHRTASLVIALSLLFCGNIFARDTVPVEKSALSPPSLFSNICDVERLGDGSFRLLIHEDPSRYDAPSQMPEKYHRLAFASLALVLEEAINSDFDEETTRRFVYDLLYEEPARTILKDIFLIYNLHLEENSVIIPLKRHMGKGIRFKIGKEGGLPKGQIISAGDRVVYFEVVSLGVFDKGFKPEKDYDREWIESILFGPSKRFSPKATGRVETSYDEEYGMHMADLNREYRAYSEGLISYLQKMGGVVTHYYEDLSDGLGVSLWTDTKWVKEDAVSIPDQLGLNIPIVSFSASAGIGAGGFRDLPFRIFPDIKNVTEIPGYEVGNNRTVYLNDSFSIKTTHRPDFLSREKQLEVLLGEYKLQRMKGGGLPYSRPAAILYDESKGTYWLVEERGYPLSLELDEAVRYNRLDKVANLIRQAGMLLRFFYDINRIPTQFDVCLSKERDRIFAVDAGPHQYGGTLRKKEHLIKYFAWAISFKFHKDNEDMREKMFKLVDRWFNEGFNDPRQFEQYKLMHQKSLITEEMEIRDFIDQVGEDIKDIWGEVLTTEVWGDESVFAHNILKPLGRSMVGLRRMCDSYAATNTGRSRSLVLYVDALRDSIFIDLETALHKMKNVLGIKGSIVLYARNSEEEGLAEKLQDLIETTLPGTPVFIISRGDVLAGYDPPIISPAEEIDDIVSYLSSKDIDSNGIPDIRAKDIFGIVRSNNNMDWGEFFREYDQQIPCVILNNSTKGTFLLTDIFLEIFNIREQSVFGNNVPYKWIRLMPPSRLTKEMYKEHLRYIYYVLNKA